ncbi:MAG: aspartate kinase [Bacteroidales bacterium]|jgi:aspartate kinase|nr:aspartate kinase [Bacteroidales bacterium]
MDLFVEKFGGASVNSANAIKNVVSIIGQNNKKRLIIFSAMGKTTNLLENVVDNFFYNSIINYPLIEESLKYHSSIIEELFPKENKDIIISIVFQFYEQITKILLCSKKENYSQLYSSIVSFGEKISTCIISEYFLYLGIKHLLLYADNIIKTDEHFQEANILWQETQRNIEQEIQPLFLEYDTIISQGFIGGTLDNRTTTLGREGSDFSASIFAYCLNSVDMTIWKDVDGFLNCDPKYFKDAVKFEQIPYSEAIELSYYGASIIHPKTIKPLENKNIPLKVKSFINPLALGSEINSSLKMKPLIPSYIFKTNQTLISISPKDFSFIVEENISNIFAIFAEKGIKLNLMQNSALSYSVCFDNKNKEVIDNLLEVLQEKYRVKYNTSLTLLTIRHYNEESIKKLTKEKDIILEQRSRLTAQFLY